MRFPLALTAKIAGHIIGHKVRRTPKFALVLQLEPLHTCNLTCTGCGRIREYSTSLKDMMSLEDCLGSATECNAPMVSICGGEPLIYPKIEELVEGLLEQSRIIYICTNAMFMRKKMRDHLAAIYQNESEPLLADLLKEELISEKDIEVIPNFVDTDKYSPGSGGRYYERSEEERVIVHTSNFRPVKRVADVVRAFSIIHKQIPARLILVGDGPDREHAMAIAADTGCLDQVEHLGNLESTETVLADADLFLLASETESFGLSMLEAMSCGVPCVSTHVGGVHEVLGETGALTARGNPGHMAEEALKFLTDEKKHAEASVAARNRATDLFNLETGIRRYEDLYRRVIESDR